MLKPTLEATYEKITADTKYVQDLASPMRKEYPLQSMASNEIFPALTKVLRVDFTECSFFLQGDPEYNAYERDIARLNIFFAESTAFGDYLRIAK